jgi:hypothetical protein
VIATTAPAAPLPAPAPPPAAAPPASEDPDVAIAFALGWQVAELYRDPHHERPDARPLPEHLPGIGSLTESQRTDLGIRQIEAGLHRLGARIDAAGLGIPAVAPVRDAFGGAPDPATGKPVDLRGCVLSLHRETLETLSAADFRLGKAYGLGRAVADTGDVSDATSLASRFDHWRIRQLDTWLADLDTALPAHASSSVRKSLARWTEWASDPHLGGGPFDWQRDLQSFRHILARQTELWRALLSGEKAGVDMLKADDYLAAAHEMLSGAAELAWGVVKRLWFVVAVIAALVAAAVVLLATTDTASGNIAAVATLAAALGVTWQGVGKAIGRAASRLERPLWGAAVNIAVAQAITRLPEPSSSATAARNGAGAERSSQGR